MKQDNNAVPGNVQPVSPGAQPTIITDAVQAEAEKLLTRNDTQKGLFIVKCGNQWLAEASERDVPKMLFSEFWYEGELCILFADTNTGKSILAVQIADSIARHEPIPGFMLEAPRQNVVYFDFELFDKQFEARYSQNYNNHYRFDPFFYRAEIDPDCQVPEQYSTFEDYLNYSLERTIAETGATVLVIDNLTYLKNETERAKDALPLMKHLKALKSRYELSILALAHTPKRDMSKPITRNDLQGSKMLINFCDSAFAIGEDCNEKSLRYLKQIKARNTEVVYDTEHVALCRIEKPYNFLQFTHAGISAERKHLKERSEMDKEERDRRILELREQGYKQQEIADELGVGLGTVNRALSK